MTHKADRFMTLILFLGMSVSGAMVGHGLTTSYYSYRIDSGKEFINKDATYKCEMTNKLKETYSAKDK